MKKALTLIEMLVALAITTLLMAAALRATSAVTRSGKVMQQRDDTLSLATGLEKLFAVDIQHANRYMLSADGFVLSVRSSLEKENLKLRHIPSVVTYKIKRIGSQTWLVRTQHQTNSEYSELVCVGVSRIYLNTAEAGLPNEAPVKEEWQKMPSSVVVTVNFEDSSKDVKLTYCLRL